MSKTSGIAVRCAWSLALLGPALLFLGCQGALLNYKGAKALDTYRIAIADGTQRSGRYQSPDLTIDYQALRNGNELQLTGEAEYTPKIRHAFTFIPYFYLSVFLIDQNGTILQDRGITTPGSNDPNNRMRFGEKIQLPPGTAYIAFSYSGQGKGSSVRETEPFWDVPIVR